MNYLNFSKTILAQTTNTRISHKSGIIREKATSQNTNHDKL